MLLLLGFRVPIEGEVYEQNEVAHVETYSDDAVGVCIVAFVPGLFEVYGEDVHPQAHHHL